MDFVLISMSATRPMLSSFSRIRGLANGLVFNGQNVILVSPSFDRDSEKAAVSHGCPCMTFRAKESTFLGRLIRNRDMRLLQHKVSSSSDVDRRSNVAMKFVKRLLYDSYYLNAVNGKRYKLGSKTFVEFISSNETLLNLLGRPNTVVITSVGPANLNKVGSLIKGRFPEVFWVADYRDATFRNPYRPDKVDFTGKRMDFIAYKWADLITSVSNGLSEHNAENARMLGVDISDKLYVLHNGFLRTEVEHERKFESIRRFIPTNGIVIAYTGTIYRQRKIECFLEAIKTMDDVSLMYAGASSALMDGFIARIGVRGKVINMGMLQKEEAMFVQKSADLLLLLKGDFREQGGIPGKFYEYLINDKPILVLGDEDEEFNTIARKIGGIHVLPYDVEVIRKFLIDFGHKLRFGIERNFEELNRYDWNSLARGLVDEISRRLGGS